ncbi:MAG: hypothetical protein DMG21_07800, partial [Acidobacteria bacterium]
MSGTDTYLAEPTVNVPTVWPYSGSGVQTHHNSEDTPDRVDPRSLRDVATVNASYLYYLANASEPETAWLAELSQTRGYEQILKATAPFLDQVSAAHDSESLGHIWGDALDHINYRVDRESQSVLSVERLAPEDRRAVVAKSLAPSVDALRRFGEEQKERVRLIVEHRAEQAGFRPPAKPVAAAPSAEASRIVVRRKRFGTLPLDDL